MDINESIIGLVVVIGIILIGYVIRQNKRDKKELVKYLNKTDKATNEKDSDFEKEYGKADDQ